MSKRKLKAMPRESPHLPLNLQDPRACLLHLRVEKRLLHLLEELPPLKEVAMTMTRR
jgi:hypothetical protein